MSFSIDVNILLYASNSTSPFHARASMFLRERAASRDLFYLTWPTIMAYLRLSTHPAASEHPLSPDESMTNIEELLARPNVLVLGEEEGFWPVYREATQGLAVRGRLVSDAHVAALLKQHDVKTFYTNDTDFRRFAFLNVINPFVTPGEGP